MIISNLPGAAGPREFVGLPLLDTYPLVPLAEGVPLAVGALGWQDELCLSVTTDPSLVPPTADLAGRLSAGLDQLRREVSAPARAPGTGSASAGYQGRPISIEWAGRGWRRPGDAGDP